MLQVKVTGAIGDWWYDSFLGLHILAAIVGFGGVLLNSVYGTEAKKRRGASALAISDANLRATGVAQKFQCVVLLFGLLLVLASGGAWALTDTWVVLSIALYVAGVGIGRGVLTASAKRMNALLAEIAAAPPASASSGPPPQAAQMAALGKRLATFSMVNRVILVAIVYLMISKPGS
jgi:uncharacterized membrane protein